MEFFWWHFAYYLVPLTEVDYNNEPFVTLMDVLTYSKVLHLSMAGGGCLLGRFRFLDGLCTFRNFMCSLFSLHFSMQVDNPQHDSCACLFHIMVVHLNGCFRFNE